jgi:hypothetical protein
MVKKKTAGDYKRKMAAAKQSTSALVAAGLRREKKRLGEIKRLADQLQRDKVRAERALKELANAVAEDSGMRLVSRQWIAELEEQNEQLTRRVAAIDKPNPESVSEATDAGYVITPTGEAQLEARRVAPAAEMAR